MTPEELQIPAPFRSAQLDDFEPKSLKVDGRLLEDSPRFQWESGLSIYVFGLNGRGKSHFAAAWAAEHNAFWVDWQTVLLDVGATFKPNSEKTMRSVLSRQIAPPRLVLDDSFRGANRDWALDSLLYVIEQRERQDRPTLITSHLELRDVHGLDSHIASRLSAWVQVAVLGDDHRGKR